MTVTLEIAISKEYLNKEWHYVKIFSMVKTEFNMLYANQLPTEVRVEQSYSGFSLRLK